MYGRKESGSREFFYLTDVFPSTRAISRTGKRMTLKSQEHGTPVPINTFLVLRNRFAVHSAVLVRDSRRNSCKKAVGIKFRRRPCLLHSLVIFLCSPKRPG